MGKIDDDRENSTEIIEKIVIFCYDITKILCSLIFLLFAGIVSYTFNELWIIFRIKYIFIFNLLLLIVFHPQHLEGLIKLPSLLLKIIKSLIKSPISTVKIATQAVLIFFLALLKILWSLGLGWILRITCFLIRGIIVSITNLIVFSIILTSVYVMIYIAFLKPIQSKELLNMLPNLYTAFGGLALLGAGIEIIKHFISQPQKIAKEEFKKWIEEFKKFIHLLLKLAKNSFTMFLEDLLDNNEITKKQYNDLLKISSYFFTNILEDNENMDNEILELKEKDSKKYILIIMSFIKTLLEEIFSKDKLKLISKEEKHQIKKMWSELKEELIIILPYTTYSTITLNYIASLSYLDLKRFLKVLSEYLKDEEVISQMSEKIENKK